MSNGKSTANFQEGSDVCTICGNNIHNLYHGWNNTENIEEGYKTEYIKHFAIEHPFELSVMKKKYDFDDTV